MVEDGAEENRYAGHSDGLWTATEIIIFNLLATSRKAFLIEHIGEALNWRPDVVGTAIVNLADKGVIKTNPKLTRKKVVTLYFGTRCWVPEEFKIKVE